VVLTSILLICLYLLITSQPNLTWFFPSIIYGMLLVLFCATVSLTAQGTSNYFNPDADPSTIKSDHDLLKASLVLLLFCNVALLGILGLFHHRCSRTGVFRIAENRNAKVLAFALYACGILMLVRNIFRTVQIFSRPHSSAWETEAFFWIFDASPMLICTLMLNFMHFGKLFPKGVGCAC
jgi:formate hydrogenlyase subunit 3/multisubunit Na+/H+ antiporter MnhD subunit